MGNYEKMIDDYGIELGVIALGIVSTCFLIKFGCCCYKKS